jgi:tripartite-type tricarboxylate transporter receptor subunit TctC
MLAVAKSRPGQITLGSSGGFQHFATALFRNLSGQDFTIVLYKGAFPAMIDVIGGQVHAIIIPIVPSLPHLRSGKLNEMRKIIPAEIAKWTKVARAAGMPRE